MATSHKVPLATRATSPDTSGEQRGGVGSKEEKVGNKEEGGNKDEEVGSKEEEVRSKEEGWRAKRRGDFLQGPNNSSSSVVNLLLKAEATPTICDFTGR